MKDQSLHIVFFPHSVDYGLAGTNRLQNIIYFLKKETNWSMANISLADGTLSSPADRDRVLLQYKEIYYGPSLLNFIQHIFQTFFYLAKFKRKGKNVIYFYGEIDIKNFFFVTWARLIGYRVIIDIVEDLDTITKYKSLKNKIKYKSAVFFRKHLNYFADGFTIVSSHLENKIRYVYPAVPSLFLPVTVNKYAYQVNQSTSFHGIYNICYCGSFNEKDGLPYLLEALQMLKQDGRSFKMILSGTGAPAEMSRFWQDVTHFNLHENIAYLGMLSRSAYINLLSEEADILCMTRTNSAFANAGFPFKLGEFLSTGKPVIASKVGDIEKYLTASDAYLVAPENALEIKNAITEIMTNPEVARVKGKNGSNVAMRYFDHEIYAAPLAEFIEHAIW